MRLAASRFLFVLSLLTSSQAEADESAQAGRVSRQPERPEPTPYSHTVWTTEEGLPQNAINAILQTRDGYLWLATFGGLARFDGISFRVFEFTNTEGLEGNRFLSLYEDSSGTLWIGLQSEGLSRYSDGRFTSYDRADGLPAYSILTMVEDHEGHLWAGTQGGLARLRDGTFTVYTEADGLPSRQIRALFVDRHGVLWIGTDQGLARYVGGRFLALSAAEGAPQNFVVSVLEDSAGALWVDTESELARYFEGRFERRLERDRIQTAVTTLAMDREGELWTLSDSRSHLYRLRDRGHEAPAEIVNLPDGVTASTIFFDREGNLWVGTNGKGLFQLQPRPVRRFTTEDGLPADEVRAITADGEGGLWLAFDCEGASPLIRWRDGAVTYYPADQNGDPLNCVSSLLRDRSGGLWLGADGELVHFKEGIFTRFQGDHEANRFFINVLFEDRDGRLWIGTEYALLRFSKAEFTTLTTQDGLTHHNIRAIMQARDGALWLGTGAGLSRLSDGRFVNYGANDGLSPGTVRAIHEDSDGTLWIGTYGGGLSRWRNGEITRYTTEDGLFENIVSRILEDRRGNLWMMGNLGLFFVNRQDLNYFADGRRDSFYSISFGSAEGMTEGSGGRHPAGWQTDDGKMWFPTIDGMAIIDAESFRINEVPPPVAIERVLVNGRETTFAATIEVPPGNRDLEIHYTGLSFAAPEKMLFEYLMEGYDEEWVRVGHRRIAYYTNLPPGAYVFRVRSSNNHGVWNETDAAVRLSIAPFFFERRWFWALCSIGLVLLVYSAYRTRLRRAVRQNRRLWKEIAERRRVEVEREALIEKLERFTYTVSHDLKTPLVTIKGFLGLLERDVALGNAERLSADIEEIKKATDTMAQLLENLLQLSRVGRQVNPPEEIFLTELAREAAQLVQERIRERGVEVVIEDPMPVVCGDRIRILEVFQNLLDNAVKFMGNQNEPRVEVGARKDREQVVYYVRDNGDGVDSRYHKKVFGLFERLDAGSEGTGIGLALAKRIIEIHGGHIWVESAGKGRGSTFCFTLGQAHYDHSPASAAISSSAER